jgi:hypothetical protein
MLTLKHERLNIIQQDASMLIDFILIKEPALLYEMTAIKTSPSGERVNLHMFLATKNDR